MEWWDSVVARDCGCRVADLIYEGGLWVQLSGCRRSDIGRSTMASTSSRVLLTMTFAIEVAPGRYLVEVGLDLLLDEAKTGC